MSAVRSAADEVIHLIESRRVRAHSYRQDAARLIVRAQRADAEADALAAMLVASGMGQEPAVQFDEPEVKT